MKRKITILTLLILTFAKLQAQDYQISFAGSGDTTTVETVQVQNLTQDTSLNISGSDVLRLQSIVTVIEPITTNGNNSLFIYPNPMLSSSFIEFEIDKTSPVIIDLYDISGKKVSSYQNSLQAGKQMFKISGLNFGVYTINVKSDNNTYTSKIISNCKNNGNAEIAFVNSSIQANKASLKNTKATVYMQYNAGDTILLKGISGKYINTLVFIPEGNSTQTFNFVECTDIDGNNYGTVTIGTQVWMTENLRVTHFRDGVAIPYVTNNSDWALNCRDRKQYCWYNDDESNKTTYGALYNYYALLSEFENIAPEGWHVATGDDWSILNTYLGGGTVAGEKMRERGTTHWSSDRGNNSSGFSALPSGYRWDGDLSGYFSGIRAKAYWWSAWEGVTGAGNAPIWNISGSNLQHDEFPRGFGMAIRCVKD